MKNRTRAVLLGITLTLAVGSFVRSQDLSASDPGRRIDDFLTRLSGFGYQGAMLVARDGKIILKKGYGYANRESNILNSGDTLFDVGSFAKSFTAAAILQLEAAGRLKVSDPIGKVLGGVPPDKAAVTIHQVLTHTSGLQDDFGNYEDIGRDEALKRILRLPLAFVPGSDYAYSNGGYVILAAVVETASGVSYRDYIKRNIFQRVGMEDTGFWGEGAPRVDPGRIARGYDELGEVGNPLAWSGTTWYDLGGGMVLSTVGDLYKWVLALEGSSVISREAAQRMFTPVAKEVSIGGYGYGWFIKSETPYRTVIQHGGDSTGFGANVFWYQDEDAIVVSLCNIRHDWFPTHVRADRVVPKILFGESFTMPPSFKAPGPGSDRILGSYDLDTGGRWVVREFRGRLEIGAEGDDAVALLTGANEEQRKAWTDRSAKIQSAFEGLLRGEFGPFDAIAGKGSREFREAVIEELRTLGKGRGETRAIRLLGTSPAGYPPGTLSTLLKFEYEKGEPLFYRVVSSAERILATFDRTAPLAAPTPIQLQSEWRYVGWDILAEKGFQVTIESDGDRVSGITVHRESLRSTARRSEKLTSGNSR